ncbi:GNAT family N-acetyltransferase, partial [Acinetobacter baumannii]
VEYVTTDYTMRGKGLATQLLKYLVETLTHLEYGLAALQPENEAFYEKLGWTVWKGNLSIKQDTFSYLTDEYEIMLYSLNIQMKDQLSNSSEEDTICADWREGELW